MLRLEYTPYTLHFKFLAKTSRGEMTNRNVWFIKISDALGRSGIGEIAPIDRLSPEDPIDVPEVLEKIQSEINKILPPTNESEVWELTRRLAPQGFPSVKFGLEGALFDLLNGGGKRIFSNEPTTMDIAINGLIWMGDLNFMKQQISDRLDAGFDCIKLKVGALDFDSELKVIKELRSVSEELIIRLDANGAFQTNEVLSRLKVLEAFDIHSIEQPILPMQPEALEIVCKKSQVPIALDEELIWIQDEEERLKLLQEIRPHYLVLKPTLHGGFESVKNWIDLASIQGIDWWITSYLESNIGLNAIAQFASTYDNTNHHGLGTGSLYENNIDSPIYIENGRLKYANTSWSDVSF